MSGRLDGKTCLVTAAGQGIGRAIAEAFACEGARVIATDLDAAKVADFRGEHRTLNVLSTSDVDTLAAEVGPIDVLANCAGYVHQGSILETSEKDWDFSFDLNVKSMHRTLKAFLPGMLANGGGSVINISSAASSIRGVPNRYAYGATKAAVIGLTKSIAADFITRGIRANAICPGTIQSPSLNERIAAVSAATGRSLEDVRADFVGRQPMGRLGTAEEIGALALYLASDESAFTTGQIHIIDGGWAL
ncbi:SDR family oxidoreductase [Roseixanthobacter glucoisosaccharinicivorans]|uniref:SDR family oxidoreductase n=1 Tax=Roseixanthobacter glucoisosaccharinicivorans TaxID=3119923 RepID=UPI00372A2F2B